jgi:hypothetical protein
MHLPDKWERTRRGKGTQKRVGVVPHSRQFTHSDDGVDLTMVRWMLSLSPSERLHVLQENVGAILRLRREQTQLPFDTSDTSKSTG